MPLGAKVPFTVDNSAGPRWTGDTWDGNPGSPTN
jgi:hypothetical protein